MRILVVDDSPDDRELVRRTLQRAGNLGTVAVTEAESAAEAIHCLRQAPFDCVLLDFSMPGTDGLDLLNDIRQRFPDLAIVMVTGSGNEKVAVQAMKGGAADYVGKGDISVDTLEAAVAQACERARQAGELQRSADTDELTGLPNRRAFNRRLAELADAPGAPPGPAFAVIFMDLDGLKAINDTLGHDAGDDLIRTAAERLSACLRPCDLLARIGGDEFVAILPDLGTEPAASANDFLRRMTAAIDEQPVAVAGRPVTAGVSAGLAIYPRDGDDRSDLLRHADAAMYEAKLARKQARAGSD